MTGDPWSEEEPERLERDEAPTPEGSASPSRGSHRSLDGLDYRVDKLHTAIRVGVVVAAIIIGWFVFLGLLGGNLYIIEKAFGG